MERRSICTAGGNIRKPGLAVVCQWVVDAWKEIPEVAKSFLKCGISSAMDGSEDDELYSNMISDDTHDDDQNEDGEYCIDHYDDNITESEFNQLFGDSDEEDFMGFYPSDIRE